MNTEASSIQMKASLSSIITWMTLLSLPLVICLLATKRQPTMWFAVVICFVGLALVLLWLNSYRIEINNGTLKVSTLLIKSRHVRLEDIADVRVVVGYPYYKDRFKPPIRLIIEFKNGTPSRPLTINLKVFEKQDINSLLLLLGKNKNHHSVS